MNSYKKDYKKLYFLQDKFLSWWQEIEFPFYLTGGTALGRFYLNHRLSEDLDFFINSTTQYSFFIAEIRKKISIDFSIDFQQSLFSDDFTRFFISQDDIFLKIDFVHDIGYYVGAPTSYAYGKIDTPINILSNKLTAITGRDEPKDIFDIIHLSRNYSFNWLTVFADAKQKAILNEIDVAQRLNSFPVKLLESVDWLIEPLDLEAISETLQQLTDDFLLGKSNSIGVNKMPIEIAKPLSI